MTKEGERRFVEGGHRFGPGRCIVKAVAAGALEHVVEVHCQFVNGTRREIDAAGCRATAHQLAPVWSWTTRGLFHIGPTQA